MKDKIESVKDKPSIELGITTGGRIQTLDYPQWFILYDKTSMDILGWWPFCSFL